MKNCTEPVNLTGKYDVGNFSDSLTVDVSREQNLDKLLFFIKVVLEYALGIHIGYGIGWLIGFFIGNSYVKHFEPAWFDNLNQLSHWRLIPYEYAGSGAIIGVIVGAIVIAINARKSKNNNGEQK